MHEFYFISVGSEGEWKYQLFKDEMKCREFFITLSGITDQQEIGLVATVFLISSVLCRPFTGKWLDDLGRKKILFISLSLFLA
ncbi:DUF3964 family protein, partial [Bacillus cereus]